MQRSNDLKRCRHVVAGLGLLLFTLLQCHATGAQVPSAEQIEIFRSLPPDQQQAILDAIGGSTTTGAPTQASRARSARRSHRGPVSRPSPPRSHR